MATSFDQIPSAFRIPIVLMEFDPTRAQQGPAIQEYKLLLMGQMLASGSAVADEVIQVNSVSQAKALFGEGSDLAFMVQAAKNNNQITDLLCLPVEDNGAGVAATGKLTVAAGVATEAGTVYLYLAGRRVTVGVAVGDDQDDVAAAIVAAITAFTDDMLPVEAEVNGVNANEVDFTARHKGETGNKVDIRLNYRAGESSPAGVDDITITPMASGVTNPSLTGAIAALGQEQYNVIGFPWLDSTSLADIEAELERRWGATVALEGIAIASANDSLSNLGVLGNSRNSQFLSILESKDSPSLPLERASAAAAVIALEASKDPARPFQTLQLRGIQPPSNVDALSQEDRNTLLFDGIATSKVSSASRVLIERMITTYQLDSQSNPDTSFLDVNTVLTLSYIRFSTRQRLGLRYPRYKLADDGTRISPGQATVTPGTIKAEMLALFREWEELGLVEDSGQFKEDLIVERSSTDPNRLDILMSPNLINQMRFFAIKTAFIV